MCDLVRLIRRTFLNIIYVLSGIPKPVLVVSCPTFHVISCDSFMYRHSALYIPFLVKLGIRKLAKTDFDHLNFWFWTKNKSK